jgi:hypothetical protein
MQQTSQRWWVWVPRWVPDRYRFVWHFCRLVALLGLLLFGVLDDGGDWRRALILPGVLALGLWLQWYQYHAAKDANRPR